MKDLKFAMFILLLPLTIVLLIFGFLLGILYFLVSRISIGILGIIWAIFQVQHTVVTDIRKLLPGTPPVARANRGVDQPD